MPLFLYPFLNTVSRTRPFEYLRLTSLGVIGALVKVDDTDVINFLLSTEIIPLCLRTMEMGSELSKTVATFIVQKILLDDVSAVWGGGACWLLVALGVCFSTGCSRGCLHGLAVPNERSARPASVYAYASSSTPLVWASRGGGAVLASGHRRACLPCSTCDERRQIGTWFEPWPSRAASSEAFASPAIMRRSPPWCSVTSFCLVYVLLLCRWA